MAVLSVAGSYAYLKYFGPQTVIQTNSDKVNCRQGNVLDGVDRQVRFTVLSTCEKVIGIVYDMTGTKQTKKATKNHIRSCLIKEVNGMLVIEIILKDQNDNPFVSIPKNGDRIEAYGASVTDKPHGWNELHPAWKVKIL